MGRYFVGLTLPEIIENKVRELSLKADPSYSAELPFHITLKSPIDLTEQQEEDLAEKLPELAINYAHNSLKICGWGSFGQKLHLKIEKTDWLVEMRDKIVSLAKYEDKHPFSPHITISNSNNHQLFEGSDWQVLKELQREDFFPESLDIFENRTPTVDNPRRWDSFKMFKFPRPI